MHTSLDLIKLAETLRRRRRELDITQKELADMSKVSQSTIAQVELGYKLLSLRSLIRITNVLGLRVEVRR